MQSPEAWPLWLEVRHLAQCLALLRVLAQFRVLSLARALAHLRNSSEILLLRPSISCLVRTSRHPPRPLRSCLQGPVSQSPERLLSAALKLEPQDLAAHLVQLLSGEQSRRWQVRARQLQEKSAACLVRSRQRKQWAA